VREIIRRTLEILRENTLYKFIIDIEILLVELKSIAGLGGDNAIIRRLNSPKVLFYTHLI